MKLEFSRQIFEKFTNIKFHENPSRGSRVVPCGRADGHGEANSRISQFCERAWNDIRTFHHSLKHCFSLHTDTTPPQPNHTVTPTHIEPEQYNPWNKSTVSRKLLKVDVLTFETCWAISSEIINQVASSWSIFIRLRSSSLCNSLHLSALNFF